MNRYSQCSGQDHWDALAKLMKYLRGIMDYVIEYSGFPVVLEGYNEKKSTSGYVFTLGMVKLNGDQSHKQLLQD